MRAAVASSTGDAKVQTPFPRPHGDIDYECVNGEGSRPERPVHFAARTQIYHQGDLVDCVYQIVHGAVMLSKLLPDGRRQIVEILGEGDVFGLSPAPIHACSAITLARTHCMAFDRSSVENSPELLRGLSTRLHAQLCALHEHVTLLGRKSAMERMASFLMRCVPGRGGYHCPGPQHGEDDTKFKLAMSRQEIADYLGLTVETVSRTLTKLRQSGVVSINRLDEIRVQDICRLCQMTGTHLTRGRWCSSREDTLIKDPWL